MIQSAVKRFVGICLVITAASSVVPGQTPDVPAKWIGTWTLRLQESRFGESWGPGVPRGGLTVNGQILKISATAGHLKVEGDTVTSEFGSMHEVSDVNLDGKETVVPPGLAISFRRIDDASFEIILKVNNKAIGNHVGENRFVFSADGKKLTETKTHTEREVVAEGTDQTKSAVLKSSTTVLAFDRAVE